jgi:hypothetical protein
MWRAMTMGPLSVCVSVGKALVEGPDEAARGVRLDQGGSILLEVEEPRLRAQSFLRELYLALAATLLKSAEAYHRGQAERSLGLREAAMRLRSRRRSLVVWSQSASAAGRYGGPPFTRTRRIRRWIRTGALLAVVGLMPLARAVRARWRPLLAGGVLTVAGVMLRGGPGGVVLLPGLLFLASAPLVPASAGADRMRRWELERELTVFTHPAQRRRAIQVMAIYDRRFPVTGRH